MKINSKQSGYIYIYMFTLCFPQTVSSPLKALYLFFRLCTKQKNMVVKCVKMGEASYMTLYILSNTKYYFWMNKKRI